MKGVADGSLLRLMSAYEGAGLTVSKVDGRSDNIWRQGSSSSLVIVCNVQGINLCTTALSEPRLVVVQEMVIIGVIFELNIDCFLNDLAVE